MNLPTVPNVFNKGQCLMKGRINNMFCKQGEEEIERYTLEAHLDGAFVHMVIKLNEYLHVLFFQKVKCF